MFIFSIDLFLTEKPRKSIWQPWLDNKSLATLPLGCWVQKCSIAFNVLSESMMASSWVWQKKPDMIPDSLVFSTRDVQTQTNGYSDGSGFIRLGPKQGYILRKMKLTIARYAGIFTSGFIPLCHLSSAQSSNPSHVKVTANLLWTINIG